MVRRKIEVWSVPNDPGGFRHLCTPPVLSLTTNDRAGTEVPGTGTMTIPADYEHVDLILDLDPEDVPNSKASLVVVFQQNPADESGSDSEWQAVFEFFVDESQTVIADDAGTVTISGPEIRSALDDGIVYYRTLTDPHYQWGAPTLTKNADLFEGTVADEEISLWTTATSGSFTIDVDSSGTPATINFDDTAADVKTAIEGLSTVSEVQVGGSGTEDDPWHIVFTDPDKTNVDTQTDGSGLSGGDVFRAVVVEGGQITPAYYTKSQTFAGDVFGNHGGGSMAVVDDPVESGGRALRIIGTTPFIGTQQIIDVELDSIGYATCEAYTTSATDKFRLVVRDINEGFIASSGGGQVGAGYEGLTVTPDEWNTITVPNIMLEDDDGDRIIVRFAVVSEGDPSEFLVKNLEYHPGFPGTTAGDISTILTELAQTRGALDWLELGYDAEIDSNSEYWDVDDLAFQADAGELLGTHVHGDLQTGAYELDLVRIPDDELESGSDVTHRLELFNPAGRGMAAGANTQIVIGSSIANGTVAKRRVPHTHYLVETYDQDFVEVTDVRVSGLPRREGFLRSEQARDRATAEKIGKARIAAEIENLLGAQVTLVGDTVVAYRDFNIGTTVPYILGRTALRHERRIHTISMRLEGGKWSDTITASKVYAGSRGSGGDSPLMLEAMRKLYAIFERKQRFLRGRGAIIVQPPPPASIFTEGGQASRTDLVVTLNTGGPGEGGNPWPINLPTYSAGDRVVVCVSCADTLAADITGVDGFTELKTSANAERGAVYQRIMDGTEGSTVDVSLAAAAQTAVAIAFVHRGLDWTVYTTDVASAFATSSVDPPQVNLSHGVDAIYDVYIFWGGAHGSGQVSVTTPSAGYTELVDENTGPGDTSAGLMVKQITGATSEDPGAFVISTGFTDCVTFAIVAQAATGEVATGDHNHDHGALTGLADDDHTQYLNVARHAAIDAADHGAGPSTDGQVLTSDGAGGAEWEDALGGVSDHGALTGLADDDHTQYLLAAGTRQATFLDVSGLTGAVSASRYVGATTSGAPASGTFAVGDYVVAQDGAIFVCTTAGTPGTFTSVAGSGSLPSGTTKGDLAVFDGTNWVRIGAGANDTVLTADSAQTEGIKWAAGGGGGGKSYVTEPGLKPPGSAHADDDEFAYTNGTDPTTQGWSWGNQDGATADIQAGRLIIANTGSTNNSNGLFKAAPSGDFDVTVRVAGDMIGNFHGVALTMLWGTLATPTRVDMHRYITNPPLIAGARMSGYGAFSSALGTNRPYSLNVLPYLRVVWDDTAEEAAFQYSVSGLAGTWRTHVSGIAGPGTPPDFIGLAIRRESAGAITGVFDFYRVNWTSDFDVTIDD
jgi:copper chaperone CopZ